MSNDLHLKELTVGERTNTKWYAAGLHFECAECGGCCSGPGEGYIWVVRTEIELIAKHLKLTPEELRRQYLRRVGLRTSIIEHSITKDCIFLRQVAGGKQCAIYPVRPNQCRTWPFWAENLSSPHAWNTAALRCSGINRGRRYSAEEIERIKRNNRWWENPHDSADSSTR
ncbi:MAG: YkgJ family cysteine cluster protein [Sedimentisphaerales bacterium]|nr:YkgJ family cysteine cluster protein [Sedimentisphaerales bacterium]